MNVVEVIREAWTNPVADAIMKITTELSRDRLWFYLNHEKHDRMWNQMRNEIGDRL